MSMVASIALILENQNEDKHVESKLLPRLDEGSTPSSSTFFQSLVIEQKKLAFLTASFLLYIRCAEAILQI